MRRQLAVAASACLLVAPAAQAQSTVRITGLVDLFAGRLQPLGANSHSTVVNGGGLSTSYLSFEGVEDLGGGLSARFTLAAFFRGDSGTFGRNDTDTFFSRDASVGLANRWGSVTLGRASAPNFLPSVLANPFGNSTPFSPLLQHSNVNVGAWTYRTTPSDTGWSNQIVLGFTPVSGLRVNLQYQLGEQASNTPTEGRKNIGANFIYASGPFSVMGYYERDQILNPNPLNPITATVAGVAVPITRQVWMLGGTYDFDIAKVYGTFGRGKSDVLRQHSQTTSAGLSVPVGSGAVLAAVARSRIDLSTGPDRTRTTWSLGYDHNLSKRTDVYAIMLRDQATALANGQSFAVGIRHRF